MPSTRDLHRLSLSVFVAVLFTFSSERNAAGVAVYYSSDAVLTLSAPNSVEMDRSGWDVAVSQDSVIVGTPGIEGKLAQFDRTTGNFVRDIEANEPQSGFFGQDLDIDEGRTIVGTWYGNSAHVFDVNTGNQLRKLTVPSSALLGWSVAIKGNRALVGDPVDNADRAGAAYIFDIGSGDVLHTLRPSDLGFYDYFGIATAIEGDYALVSGRNYIYQFDLESGGLLRKLRGTDSSSDFGANIAVDSNRMIVSDGFRPAAYVIDLNTGMQIQKLQAPGVTSNDEFGSDVDISGDFALVGACNTNIDGVGDAGMAYLFRISTGELLAKFQLSQPEFNNSFGWAVRLEGTTAYISAPGVNDFRGAVYVFEIPEPSTLFLLAVGAVNLLGRRKR